MQLPDGANTVPTMPAPLADGTFGWFTNTFGAGPGTVVTPDFLNGIAAEILNVIEAAGLTPEKTDTTQLLQALQKMSAGDTGDICQSLKSTKTGWVLLSGRTVGDAASGATERANADCADLFAELWTLFDNTRLPIQDSGGSPSSRGASAAADFAAHKRMPLLDGRDVVLVGRGNMGGTAANLITVALNGFDSTVLGAHGGQGAHALAANENGPHTHPGFVGSGSNGASVGGPVAGGTAGNTGSSGSGDPHQNVQPSLVVNFFVKL